MAGMIIDVNGFTVEQAMRYLSGETKGDVALCYEPLLPEVARWHVECEFNDKRYIVPGTESPTPERALQFAIYKWRNRSIPRPYMGYWEQDTPV